MCGSGPDEEKPSAHDIALTNRSGKDDERFVKKYMPLEIFEIEQFRDPKIREINKGVIEGRVSADVAQQERAAYMSTMKAAQASGVGLSGANAQALAEDSFATGSAVSRGQLEADQVAQNIHDAEGLSIIRTGEGINRGNTENLANLARQENYKASSRLKARQVENQARAKALGDVASVAVIGGYDAWKRGRSAEVPDEKLSVGAKAVRGLFGQRDSGAPTTEGFTKNPNTRGWADRV